MWLRAVAVLAQCGYRCSAVAPSLIPKRLGDHAWKRAKWTDVNRAWIKAAKLPVAVQQIALAAALSLLKSQEQCLAELD